MGTTTRHALAVAAGTAVIFVWGAFSHLVLIRGVGFSVLPHEDATMRALAGASLDEGLYTFPAPPHFPRGGATASEMEAWEARFRAGPTGFVVYHPEGGAPFSPRKLFVQLAADLVAVIVAVLVAASIAGSLLRRAASIAALGVFALASVSTIYWNWYGYPHAFFAAQCLDVIGGWSIAGLVVAALVPSPRSVS